MDNILEVRDLKVHYPIRKGVFSRIAGYVRALDGVNLQIENGEFVAIEGTSGSGKSGKDRWQHAHECSTKSKYTKEHKYQQLPCVNI